MDQYNVTGMTCAACSARVEKAVSKVEGVTSCSVSLLTNSMGVEGTASAASIIAAVEHLVIGCLLCVTIIGIPFGLQQFKLAKLALMPFGTSIVYTNHL